MNQMDLFSMQEQGKRFSAICDTLGVEDNTPAWPDRFGAALRQWIADNHIPAIRTLSLFSGAGGLDIGFADAGFDIVASVEIEEEFCRTLRSNSGPGKQFEHAAIHCVDIREFSGCGLGQIDFIIGGPPCQTFSAAGRRANGVSGTTDARGVLFKEYVRLLRELSPRGFLFENVYGIVGAQGGKAWAEIVQAFSALGYRLYHRILDAADYGVPQHRERLIIVGLKEGTFKFPRPTHGLDSVDGNAFYNAGTAVEGVSSREREEEHRVSGRYANLLPAIPPGLNYSFYTEEMGHPHPVFAWRSKFSDFLYKADPSVPVRTIKASGGAYTGPLHWENRFFTYEEYKRLQTFPDDYEISGGKQAAVKQIGNSVPPQMARMMAVAIRQQVFGTKFPFTLALLEEFETLGFRKRKREQTHAYRKKAEMAIRAMKREEKALPDSREYACSIQPNFKFKEEAPEDADFKIVVTWGEDLTISVADIGGEQTADSIKVAVVPRDGIWTLGVRQVLLRVKTTAVLGFTAAWKAFERELIDNGIRADLVQLNGYYQYLPKLVCRCETAGGVPFAHVLEQVVAGTHVAALVTGRQLSQCWDLPEDQVMAAAEHLKRLGYEVRNHATNPQIPAGNWLIPYAFPTLNPLSVQLGKRLR